MKICTVGAEFFFRANRRSDRQTDRHDVANGRFSQFRNSILTLIHFTDIFNSLVLLLLTTLRQRKAYTYRISRPIRCTVIFSLEILGKKKMNVF